MQTVVDRLDSIRTSHRILLIAALFILWLGNFTDVDIALADAMFDRNQGIFPMRQAWLTDRFNHVLLKAALVIAGAVVGLLNLWDLFSQLPWRPATRSSMRILGLSAVLVPAAIGAMKRYSASHCPWDLDRYGGQESYIRLLEAVPAGVTAGHCLPAGHASSALWLVALAVFWLPSKPRTATLIACALLLFGFAVGWMQQLRGAHFLSHTLWSMWIAAYIVDALYWRFKVKPNPTGR